MSSGVGGSVGFPATWYTPLTTSRPSYWAITHPSTHIPAYNCHHSPATAPQSTQLERETTPSIRYDIRSPTSFATSRRHLIDDDRWQCEKVFSPSIGSQTILTALISKPVVVFLSRIDGGAVKMCLLPCTTRCELLPSLSRLTSTSRVVKTRCS